MFLSDKLGIPVWLGEAIVSLAIIILAIIVSRVVSLIIEKLRDRLEKSDIADTFEENPFRKLRRPLMFLMVLLAQRTIFLLKDITAPLLSRLWCLMDNLMQAQISQSYLNLVMTKMVMVFLRGYGHLDSITALNL